MRSAAAYDTVSPHTKGPDRHSHPGDDAERRRHDAGRPQARVGPAQKGDRGARTSAAAAVLEGLTEAQRAVATHLPGALRVLAGAGVGKTHTLVRRAAYAVLSGFCRADEVLCLTFSRAAADELKHRLTARALLGDAGEAVVASTYHSFARRILREHPHFAGLSARFGLLKEAQSRARIRDLLTKIGVETASKQGKKHCRAVAGAISRLKDYGFAPEDIATEEDVTEVHGLWALWNAKDPGAAPDPVLTDALAVFADYQDGIMIADSADFADLVLWTVRGLEDNPDLCRPFAQRYKLIMADEYQDTNSLQERLLRLLASQHGNLMVVGDDSQALYAWRGADHHLILEFEQRWEGATTLRLEDNFRSTPRILAAANGIIAHNATRAEKALRAPPDSAPGLPIVIMEAFGVADTTRAGLLYALHLRRTTDLRSIFINYRSSFLSRQIELAAASLDLAYRVVGDDGFFGRLEIKDALAMAQVLDWRPGSAWPEDAWRRVGNHPARGLGDRTLDDLTPLMVQAAAAGEDPFIAAAALPLRAPAMAGLGEWVAARAAWAKRCDDGGAFDEQIESALRELGHIEHWSASADPLADARLENLEELIVAASETGSLAGLLDQAAVAAAMERQGNDDQVIRIGSIHGVKGLEADIVISPAWAEGILPSKQAIDVEERFPDRIEHERNLAYVDVTRARRMLILGAPDSVTKAGASRFLAELPARFEWQGRSMPIAVRRTITKGPRPGQVPSDRQVAYARSLAADRGQDLPDAVLRDAAILSTWIDLARVTGDEASFEAPPRRGHHRRGRGGWR
jgi:DNA helicase-2/ATP-dependent DNA helicase PcrA